MAKGAVMEYCQGWERPGYYIENATAPVRGFDWYGYYDHVRNTDRRYEKQLEGDRTFGFSKHHDIVRIKTKILHVAQIIFLYNFHLDRRRSPCCEEQRSYV